jgi:hypothetical protein
VYALSIGHQKEPATLHPDPYFQFQNTLTGLFYLDSYISCLLDRSPLVSYNSFLCHIPTWNFISTTAKAASCLSGSSFSLGSDLYDGFMVVNSMTGSPSAIDPNLIFGGRSIVVSTPLIEGSSRTITVGKPLDETIEARFVSSPIPKVLNKSWTIPHSEIIGSICNTKLWSMRRIASILNVSIAQISRIKNGAVASAETGHRIDELSQFVSRLQKVTNNNPHLMKRVLTATPDQGGRSAKEWLAEHDLRRAFSAVMDALSPRPRPIDVGPHDLLWYDEPSRAIFDQDGNHDV